MTSLLSLTIEQFQRWFLARTLVALTLWKTWLIHYFRPLLFTCPEQCASAINMFTMIKLHDEPHWSPPSCCRWRGMQWGKPRRSRRQLSKWRSPGGYLVIWCWIRCGLCAVKLVLVMKKFKRFGAAYNIELIRVSRRKDIPNYPLVDIARDGGRQIPSDDDRNHGN